jgi:hypothetical protein
LFGAKNSLHRFTKQSILISIDEEPSGFPQAEQDAALRLDNTFSAIEKSLSHLAGLFPAAAA